MSAAEVRATPARNVVVSVRADGILIGGMTYSLDPDRAEPMPQDHADHRGDDGKRDCTGPAERLLRCLDLPDDNVGKVRLRRIGIDIDINGC